MIIIAPSNSMRLEILPSFNQMQCVSVRGLKRYRSLKKLVACRSHIFHLLFFIFLVSPVTSGAQTNSERAVRGDLDGDRKTDILVTRPTLVGNTHKLWLSRLSSGAASQPILFGLSTDSENAADFDGDGRYDLAVTRLQRQGVLNLAYWYVRTASGANVERQFGFGTDLLRTGYFDSDNLADPVAIRKQGGGLTWIASRSTNPASPLVFNWGLEDDTAFVGDFNGDGLSDAIVARDNQIPGFKTWFVRDQSNSGAASNSILFGLSSDMALAPADFDGDGRDDLALLRLVGDFPTIFIRQSGQSGPGQIVSFQFGIGADLIAVGNHFDSGRANLLAFRASQNSAQALNFLSLPADSGNFSRIFNFSIPFGLSGDRLIDPLGFPSPSAARRFGDRLSRAFVDANFSGQVNFVNQKPERNGRFCNVANRLQRFSQISLFVEGGLAGEVAALAYGRVNGMPGVGFLGDTSTGRVANANYISAPQTTTLREDGSGGVSCGISQTSTTITKLPGNKASLDYVEFVGCREGSQGSQRGDFYVCFSRNYAGVVDRLPR